MLVTIFAGDGRRQRQIFIISSIKWTTYPLLSSPQGVEGSIEGLAAQKKTFHHLILPLELPKFRVEFLP